MEIDIAAMQEDYDRLRGVRPTFSGRLTFGKYAGFWLDDKWASGKYKVPGGYLRWMLTLDTLASDLRDAIEKELVHRHPPGEPLDREIIRDR